MPAGAATLGQKLCKKDGSKVEYPKMPLPSEKKWGPEMWTENYRDKNRIETHESGTAPCKTACPAHIAVQGYVKLAAQGRYTDALELIKKNNLFLRSVDMYVTDDARMHVHVRLSMRL